jgi:nitrate reductase molybdenum cofactor assembly chaperone
MDLNHYNLLAELFRYPDTSFRASVQEVQALLDRAFPEAATELQPFTAFVSEAEGYVLEELYTRSFDVQALTTMDLGYVLFGDDYKRGAVLVHLSEEHKAVGNDCRNELADHLPNVLRLLPLMTDSALREELVGRIVGPALEKIILEFEPTHVAKKRKVYEKHHNTWIERSESYGTIYRHALAALYTVIKSEFRILKAEEPGPTSDFLRNIGTEIVLEAQ